MSPLTPEQIERLRFLDERVERIHGELSAARAELTAALVEVCEFKVNDEAEVRIDHLGLAWQPALIRSIEPMGALRGNTATYWYKVSFARRSGGGGWQSAAHTVYSDDGIRRPK